MKARWPFVLLTIIVLGWAGGVAASVWPDAVGANLGIVLQGLSVGLVLAFLLSVPMLAARSARRYEMQALQLLSDLQEAHRRTHRQNWLLPFRGRIRQVSRVDARRTLTAVIEQARDPKLLVLAIWLRGRLGGIDGTSNVARFAAADDFQTRKEVARALGRMGAWRELREMAKWDSHPRVRQMASLEPARPYGERLAAFASHAERVEAPAMQRRLYVAPEVDLRLGRPPKPIELIRAILERIHRLVMGH
jgi:hypothetical protein